MKTISDKIKSILTVATKTSDLNEIAAQLNVKVQVISGSLATIKKEELATYADHKLVLTKAGLAAINVTTKKVKNKEVVATIFNANPGMAHKELVQLIATTLNRTLIASRVYLRNFELDSGLRVVGSK